VFVISSSNEEDIISLHCAIPEDLNAAFSEFNVTIRDENSES
jgi:hypothetical protein